MSKNEFQAIVKVRHPLLVLEDALVLCSFGRFHVRLLLGSLASIYASALVTTTTSYILPNAECDLHISLMEKGLLTAGPFIGFVCASLLSCFFVDLFGRRIFLIGGHAAIFIFTVLEASSQSYWNLLLMKVLEGASAMLCLIGMLATVAEFTHKGLRNRIAMFIISFVPLALIGCTLLSWALLPHQEWHFVVWKGYFELHAWNIYLYVCSVFSLLAMLLYCTIPESPRYLLFEGKEYKALEILKDVYSENTGNDRDAFPIKSLGSLRVPGSTTIRTRLKKYLSALNQLFAKPVAYRIMLFSFISFVTHLIYNVIRLWYPQLSTIIENYRKEHGNTDRFCTMLNHYTDSINMVINNITFPEVCVPTPSGPETYVNMIVVSLIIFFAINVSGYVMNHLGPKLTMFILFVLCAVSSGALYLASSSYQIALLVSAICSFLQANLAVQKTFLANSFPVSLKVVGLSIVIMWGRVGALLGNILFPVLLQIDCAVPLLTFSILILSTSALVYFIPSKNNVTK